MHIKFCYMTIPKTTPKADVDLFQHKGDGHNPALHQPLPERLRPRTLAEVVGQQQVLGAGMPLRLAV